MAAASCSSGGTPCSAARYTITENPVQPQMVIATMTYKACEGEARNGCGEIPTTPRAALIKPKSRFVSQRKAMACEMVDTAIVMYAVVR